MLHDCGRFGCDKAEVESIEVIILVCACGLQDSHSVALLRRMKRETRDLLESDDSHAVLTTCLDTAFARVMDKLTDYYRPTERVNGTVTTR